MTVKRYVPLVGTKYISQQEYDQAIADARQADAANAKTKLENGFDLTNYDERTLAFAKDYSNQLLACLLYTSRCV